MTALTSDLPRKSSRTSTQAVIVPNTALMATTMNATANVSFSAPEASELETVCQKACAPSCFDSQTSAASGKTTMTSRNVVITPTERAVLALPVLAILRGVGAEVAARLLMGRASNVLLDLHHAALIRFEPHGVGLAPAAEELVVDLEDETRADAAVDRPVPGLREDLLRRG